MVSLMGIADLIAILKCSGTKKGKPGKSKPIGGASALI
jgi:hypothetical protein